MWLSTSSRKYFFKFKLSVVEMLQTLQVWTFQKLVVTYEEFHWTAVHPANKLQINLEPSHPSSTVEVLFKRIFLPEIPLMLVFQRFFFCGNLWYTFEFLWSTSCVSGPDIGQVQKLGCQLIVNGHIKHEFLTLFLCNFAFAPLSNTPWFPCTSRS